MARKPVCPDCGSANVLIDAWAQWSDVDDEFGLVTTFDNGFCEDCGARDCDGAFRHAEWVKVEKPDPAKDEFVCLECRKVLDVEESVRTPAGLICELCDEQLKAGPPMHRAGDPVAIPAKPFHITIQWGENPEAQHEQTYKFRTNAEITAFREGIQESQGWFDYEITYTDEEYDDG